MPDVELPANATLEATLRTPCPLVKVSLKIIVWFKFDSYAGGPHWTTSQQNDHEAARTGLILKSSITVSLVLLKENHCVVEKKMKRVTLWQENYTFRHGRRRGRFCCKQTMGQCLILPIQGRPIAQVRCNYRRWPRQQYKRGRRLSRGGGGGFRSSEDHTNMHLWKLPNNEKPWGPEVLSPGSEVADRVQIRFPSYSWSMADYW